MIEVLRLGHRIKRDERLTSHVALVARAFGADKVYYSGQRDSSLENSINKVVDKFGGRFKIEYIKNPINFLKEAFKKSFSKKYKIVNLTVYGLPIQKEINKIKKFKNIVVIVGSTKVPINYYKMADFNISITQQPHSEVAALSIFLDKYFNGKELNKRYKNAKLRIVPQEKGKLLK